MISEAHDLLFGDGDPVRRRERLLNAGLAGCVPLEALTKHLSRWARAGDAKSGAVATGSPHATAAGMDMLRRGGSAADAAAAAAFALMVADPANCSPAGRAQILYQREGAETRAIDGSTRAPGHLPKGISQLPEHQAVPVPGAVRAILKLQREAGRLSLGEVASPALILARDGFSVAPELARIWQWRAPELRDGDARAWYLPEGAAPKAGTQFHHSGLAGFFEAMIALDGDPFAEPGFARAICERLNTKGVLWTGEDLMAAEPLHGEVISWQGENWRLDTIGRQGWGHTLMQIVALMDRVEAKLSSPLDVELGHLLAVLRAFDDRPQELRSLKPKSDPIPWEDLVTRLQEPVAPEWREVMALLEDQAGARDIAKLSRLLTPPRMAGGEDRDTTHLAVIDADGMRVSLTQSIGPHFGARVADPETGILLAHSYAMCAAPEPGVRDVTEQCPSLLDVGSARYAIGGAGSERIPGAVAAVIRGLLEGKLLPEAMTASRANWVGETVRLHVDAPAGLEDVLASAGITVQFTGRGPVDHLGIVQAAGRDGTGFFTAAADPAYAGTAMVE